MIPWSAILRHAPTLLAAADALLIRSKADSAKGHARGSEARLSSLEEGARSAAQLTQEMAQQIQALVAAHEVAARRAGIALGLSIAAAVLAVVAGILALVS